MKGTRGMLQSSSNPCLRQHPFNSLPTFINWADFVHVYNLACEQALLFGRVGYVQSCTQNPLDFMTPKLYI